MYEYTCMGVYAHEYLCSVYVHILCVHALSMHILSVCKHECVYSVCTYMFTLASFEPPLPSKVPDQGGSTF